MSHITNQGLVEMAINEHLCWANHVPRTVAAITALLDAKDARIAELEQGRQMSAVTRIIRITECHQCPFRFRANYTPRGFVYKCELVTHTLPCPPSCPPTGTPDWCPLETLEEKPDA